MLGASRPFHNDKRALKQQLGLGILALCLMVPRQPVEAILRSGLTPAEEILARYDGEWGRSVAPLFREYAF